jgi:hypothetical protein
LYSDFHRIEFAWCGIWAIKQQFLNRAPVKFKQKPSHISTVINATDLDQLLLPEWSEIQLSVAVAELGRLSTRFFWHTPGADLWRLKLGALCRILALTSDNYTESFQRWYGKRWIQTLGPIVESIKLQAYPNFRAMQMDYPELQIPPPELMAKPDFDPLTGAWENIHPEQARETLYAAWMTASNERNRRHRPPKVWRGFVPKPVPVSWIEKTLKEDA